MNDVVFIVSVVFFMLFATCSVYFTSGPRAKEKCKEDPFAVIVLGISTIFALAIAASVLFL